MAIDAETKPGLPNEKVPSPAENAKRTHVAWFLGRVQSSERQLAESLDLVAARHEQDPEIHHMARLLATWSWLHVERVKPLIARYGEHTTPDPEQLRAALFHGNR